MILLEQIIQMYHLQAHDYNVQEWKRRRLLMKPDVTLLTWLVPEAQVDNWN